MASPPHQSHDVGMAMMSDRNIVESGGWVEKDAKIRPRTRLLFNIAKYIAIPAFLGVLYLMGVLDGEVLIDPWARVLAWTFIVLEIMVLAASVISFLREKPQSVLVNEQNPDVDARNLYSSR